MSRTDSRSSYKKGFTIFELTIVLSIFVVMTTILVANYRKFGNTLDLSNLTYDIAMTIRQAQSYGISSKVSAAVYAGHYGVSFSTDTLHSYALFADNRTAPNSTQDHYDASDADAQLFTLPSGYSIKYFCGLFNQAWVCSNGSGITGVSKLNILFVRPEPDANVFLTYIQSGNPHVDERASAAKIIVQAPDGRTKMIRVLSTGQISVELEEADSNSGILQGTNGDAPVGSAGGINTQTGSGGAGGFTDPDYNPNPNPNDDTPPPDDPPPDDDPCSVTCA